MKVSFSIKRDLFERVEAAAESVQLPTQKFVRQVLEADVASRTLATQPPILSSKSRSDEVDLVPYRVLGKVKPELL